LHFHGVGSIVGLPKTSEAMAEALTDPIFLETFAGYIDTVTPPIPFLAESGSHQSACPMDNCTGTLEPLPFPGEAYCRRRADQEPVNTSHCPECDSFFKHKEVLLRQIHAFAAKHGIDINPLVVEEYRCHPPELSSEGGELSDKELVYLALSILDFQIHHETHTKSCFKITSRTPNGFVCRYLFPRLARLLATYIDIVSGKIVSHRPIGCEYYNICSLLWIRLTKSNMDLQFLINGGGRRTTSYSTKYTFKAQQPASALTLKIGLLTESFKRTLTSADNANLSPLERGRRAINKALYQFTKPQELHLTMVAYILLNDGPFVRSHEPVYVNLKQLCASVYEEQIDDRRSEDYLDTDDDGEESNSDTDVDGEREPELSDEDSEASQDDYDDVDGDEEHDEQDIPVDDDEDGDEDDDEEDFGTPAPKGCVDVQISNYSLYEKDGDNDDADNADLEPNEADRYLDGICLLTDYWYRPACMKDLHYAFVRENFHIVKGKPSGKSGLAMQPGHPNPEKRYWLRNEHQERRCLIFVGGKV